MTKPIRAQRREGATRRRTTRAALAAIAIATALLAASCRPPPSSAPALPRVPRPAPVPLLSESQAIPLLTALEREHHPRPLPPKDETPWANFNTALRRARFLADHYAPSEPLLAKLSEELAAAREARAAMAAGTPPPPIPGERCEGYYSDLDGSFQPFLRYLPTAATRKRGRPLIVFLHGYTPDLNLVSWDYFPTSLRVFAEREGFCLAAPFARSNTDFQGVGEQDVLRVIAEMRNRYGVDEDRILLTGISMGGMGVWTIGAHYPDRFAGLLVVSGRGDYYFWQHVTPDELPSYKRQLIDAEFGYSLLPNLAHARVFSVHGAEDSVIPVEEARHMARALQAMNPDMQHVEIQGGDHWIYEDAYARADVQEWMRTCRRRVPSDFQYLTWSPRYDRAWWIRAVAFDRAAFPARIAVSVTNGAVHVRTSAIRSLRLCRERMPAEMRNLPVEVDGGIPFAWETNLTERANDGPAAPAEDAPQPTAGPVKAAFLGPFTFVCTADRGDTNAMARFAACADQWERYAKSKPRIAFEKEMTEEDFMPRNVFVFGEPERSAMARRILQGSPVTVTSNAFRVGEHTFPREGHGLYLVRPSPWNPHRLAVLQCGLPWGAGLPYNHPYDFLPDYIIYTAARDADGSNTALCAGFFDEAWRLCPSLRYLREGQRERIARVPRVYSRRQAP